eukprot:922735-Pyramimonas_sp.AAC.1
MSCSIVWVSRGCPCEDVGPRWPQHGSRHLKMDCDMAQYDPIWGQSSIQHSAVEAQKRARINSKWPRSLPGARRRGRIQSGSL